MELNNVVSNTFYKIIQEDAFNPEGYGSDENTDKFPSACPHSLFLSVEHCLRTIAWVKSNVTSCPIIKTHECVCVLNVRVQIMSIPVKNPILV